VARTAVVVLAAAVTSREPEVLPAALRGVPRLAVSAATVLAVLEVAT
jgi:hypothetical protein